MLKTWSVSLIKFQNESFARAQKLQMGVALT